VFLGFLVVLGHFGRIAGSFIVGGIFALGLFGVSEERALAMVLVVQGATMLSVACIGTLTLWQQGVALSDVRAAGAANARTA
jgi:glycosyltransferase 2 family protein